MCQLLKEDLQNLDLLAARRRASTLRSRVRGVQKFWGWLAAAHGISFPDSWLHYSYYVQVRLAEPCVRGALKRAHSCYIFLQEVAGVSLSNTRTKRSMWSPEKRSWSRHSRAVRQQAPRYATVLLAALEDLIKDPEARLYWKMLAWWLLVQAWGTLRFDDHRSSLPSDVVVDNSNACHAYSVQSLRTR